MKSLPDVVKQPDGDKFIMPFTEKFIYDLNAVPSMIQNCNFSSDAYLFRMKRSEITAKHQAWLLKYPKANHQCPVTQFPVTSGELAILHFQKQHRDILSGRELQIKRKQEKTKQKKLFEDLFDRYEKEERKSKRNKTQCVKKSKHMIICASENKNNECSNDSPVDGKVSTKSIDRSESSG